MRCLPCLLLLGCTTASIEDGAVTGPLTQVSDGFVSAFIAETGDGSVLLVDATNDPDSAVVVDALAERGYGPEDVVAVLMTHAHGDHTRGARAFDAPLLGLEEDTALLAEETDGAVSLDGTVRDGDTRTFGDLTVRVYSVPGHTPGSAVYLIDDVLVLGDVLVAKKDGAVGPPPSFFSEDPDQNDRSVRALSDRLDAEGAEISWMVFSHSAPLSGAGALRAF